MLFRIRLKELRGTQSQQQFLNDFNKRYNLDIKQTRYSLWERGGEPSIDILIKLADYYDVTLDYLMGRVDYKQPEYRQVNIDTGLSQDAIQGVKAIRDASTYDNNKIKALNYLLENDLNTNFSHFLEMISRYDFYQYYNVLNSLKKSNDCSESQWEMIKNMIEDRISSSDATQLKEMLRVWREDFQEDFDMPF